MNKASLTHLKSTNKPSWLYGCSPSQGTTSPTQVSVSKLHSNSNVVCRLTKRLLEPGRCHFNFIFYSKSLIWLFADDTSSSSQLFDRGREVKKPVNFKKEKKRKIPLNVHQCWNRLNPRQIKMSVDLPREDSQHQVQDKKGADDD